MTWWQRLFRPGKMEEQLEKELRFHLDQHTTDLIARGHSPEEARRLARLALGCPEQVKEQCRDALFALAASLVSGLVFGLAPALRAPVHHLEQTLRAGARTVAGNSRRLHSGFIISEIALAVVLLVAAGMLGRTVLRLSSLDPGVNIRNVLITRVALSPRALASPAQICSIAYAECRACSPLQRSIPSLCARATINSATGIPRLCRPGTSSPWRWQAA